MKKRILLCLFIVAFTTILKAQKLSVPDSILNELQTVKVLNVKYPKDSLTFKVVYPDHYDSSKTYPVLLGLSGGNQSEAIVNYCYAAWFRSDYFNNHIMILPVNKNKKNLLHFSKGEIVGILKSIKGNFKVSKKDWIIVGTSNGGMATFNFISEEPNLFEGGIVIPGALRTESAELSKSWSHLRIILAYGDKDEEDWIKGSKQSKEILSEYVKSVETLVLEGQGHILPIDFDIDFVYKKYFENN